MFSLNLHGQLRWFNQAVMAIVNVTDDSFYAASRTSCVARRVEELLVQGADILDIGAYSTRPGHSDVPEQEERQRLVAAVREARRVSPEAVISVDTFRASVAEAALEAGADIVNDVKAGADPAMFPLILQADTPYIIMSDAPDAAAVMTHLAAKVAELQERGAKQLILDPGFGFGKSVETNWEVMRALPLLREAFTQPLLVGISRKSMLWRPLGITPEEALPATTAAHLAALQSGADILRVHDPAAAVQARHLAALLHPTFAICKSRITPANAR